MTTPITAAAAAAAEIAEIEEHERAIAEWQAAATATATVETRTPNAADRRAMESALIDDDPAASADTAMRLMRQYGARFAAMVIESAAYNVAGNLDPDDQRVLRRNVRRARWTLGML